jgi:hypothetical protein
MIPALQNTGGGGDESGFFVKNRVLDADDFRVAILQ